jgi:ribosomal protein S9
VSYVSGEVKVSVICECGGQSAVYRSVTCGVLRAVQCSSPEFRNIWTKTATLIRL